MATPVRIETVVGEDGVIQVRAPELAPGQHVTVTIEATETAEKQHAIDIIANLPGHRQFKTAEEVDAYVSEERDSWDR
jgi:hypothetical protein